MSDREEKQETATEESLDAQVNGDGDAGAAAEHKEKKGKSDQHSDEEEEESEDEEAKVGLLEQPILLEGKRVRKSVERLTTEMLSPPPAESTMKIPNGKGDKLGDCKRICYFLNKTSSEDLKPFHRLLFGRDFKMYAIKKHIRLFNGYDFEVDSPEYKKKLELLNRFFRASLAFLCETMDLERSGTKEELVERLWKFLLLPKDSGKPLPETPKAKAAKKKSKPKAKPAKKDGGESQKKESSKKKSTSDKSGEEDAVSVSSLSSDDEDAPKTKKKVSLPKVKAATPKKKATPSKKGTPQKKTTPKITPKKAESAKKADSAQKKATPKKATPKRKADDSDDEDEPLAKKPKGVPTNKELKALVKKLLDGADLSTMTMKNILNQVYEKYPGQDLASKKDFIKGAVKEIIS